MKTIRVLPVFGWLLAWFAGTCFAQDTAEGLEQRPLRARYIITVADDFVVDVYHNGKLVPHEKRKLLLERFGATAERIDVEVHAGDWIVFNVVNNRLRWDGVYYFAATGCLAKNEFGFVSELGTHDWSSCDNLAEVEKFISDRDHLREQRAREIDNPWREGDEHMRKFCGDTWAATPIWGASRNTWLKINVR